MTLFFKGFIISVFFLSAIYAQENSRFVSNEKGSDTVNKTTSWPDQRMYSLDLQGIPKKQQPFNLSLYQVSDLKSPLETEINYPVLGALGVVYLGAGIGVHIYQRNAWWKDNRTAFHFQNDWPYALWLDKIGHFYAATLLSHAFSVGLEASGFQSEPAMIWGSAAALAFQYYVEIEDGFGAQWGFSPGDAIANTLGAGYALAQYYSPFLQNFQFKFSYYPSEKMREGIHEGNIIDDYEGQKYWLSIRVKELLQGKASDIWPSFLNIAVGYGISGMDGLGGGTKEFYIGFDLEAQALPLYGKFWQFFKNTLNYFHLPMPGLRITPDTAFFVFLF